MDISAPKLIQSFVWPALLRGRDVIGIAPKHHGKTYGYLLPLLTQLMQPVTYDIIPPGSGPLALILCSSWKKARQVYIDLQEFVDVVDHRVLLIYGGGLEDNQEVSIYSQFICYSDIFPQFVANSFL